MILFMIYYRYSILVEIYMKFRAATITRRATNLLLRCCKIRHSMKQVSNND